MFENQRRTQTVDPVALASGARRYCPMVRTAQEGRIAASEPGDLGESQEHADAVITEIQLEHAVSNR